MSGGQPPRQQAMSLAQAIAFGAQQLRDGRLQEAEKLLRACFEAAPANPEAAVNLAVAMEHQGRFTEALDILRQAHARAPADPLLRTRLGVALLRQGDYRSGFELFESRAVQVAAGYPVGRPKLPYPEWDGSDITSLLIVPEQGYGDFIQFARYIRVLRERGVAVSVLTHPPLARLLEPLEATIIPMAGSVRLPQCDAWVLAGSLPLRMGTTVETIPPAEYLASGPGGHGVGLMAKGNPAHPNDLRRSLPDDLAAQLSTELSATSLDPDATGARDFEATREVIAGLELVVSVDTAVAHLAGSMGKPCWLLLPFVPDWRWLLGRADSPWYPSVRLFRQPAYGDWASVVADVKTAWSAR